MAKISPTKFNKIFLLIATVFLFVTIFFVAAPSAHAALPTVDPIYKVLTPTANCTGVAGDLHPASHCFSGMGEITANIWYDIMAVVNSLVLAALIWIAFMNILRVQLDSYAVKKILPTFIMAVILANFSFLIARMLIDIANIAISAFLTGNQTNGVTGAFNSIISGPTGDPLKGGPAGPTGYTGNYAGYIIVYILKQIFVGVGAVLVAILAFIFLIRNYFIYFLICIAPAACMSLVLPVTKKYFQQWWSQFIKWIFMPVISVFWLWLAGEFLAAISTGGTWVLPMGFAGLCLYMAITSPFKAGGAAVTAWSNFGKKSVGKVKNLAWEKTGAKDYVGFQTGVAKDWTKDKFRRLPGINKIDRMIGKGQVTKDLYTRKVAKRDSLRKNANFVNYVNDKGPGWLEKIKESDPVTSGRLKAVLGDMAKEETGPNYKDQYTVRDLANKQLYHKAANGTRTRADVYKIMSDPAYRAKIEDYFGKSKKDDMADSEKQAGAIAEFIASSQEIRRRYNQRKAATHLDKSMGSDPSQTIEDFYIKEGIFQTKDYRDLSRRTGGANDELLDPPTRYKAEDRRDRDDGIPTDEEDELPEEEEESPASGAPASSEIERLLMEINDTLKKKGEAETDINQAVANLAKPGNVGVGLGRLSELEVRIKSIDPAAGEQLRLLQTRVAKAGSAQAMKMAQEQESTLQAVARILKTGKNPKDIEHLVEQGRQMMNQGNYAGAQEIARQIAPETEVASNLETGGSPTVSANPPAEGPAK